MPLLRTCLLHNTGCQKVRLLLMRTCRQIFFVICVITIILALSIAPATARKTPAPGKNKIIVGGEIDYPPYSFLDKNGEPTGFQVELTRAVAKTMGMDVEVRLMPWPEARKALENGKIDIIPGMFYSEDRARIYDFSPPFSIVSTAIYARINSPSVQSIEDLRNKEIIVMRSEAMHDYILQHRLTDRILLTETPAEALRLLAAGKGDYALVAQMPGFYWIKELNLSNVKSVGPSLEPFKNCFAVRKGNTLLLSRFTEGLNIINQTGEYQKISEKWLGVLEPTRINFGLAIKYAAIVFVPLILLLALSVLWSWMLRSRVNIKTKELLESETKYRTLVDNARDMVFRTDANGNFTFANPAALRCAGYKEEDIIGRRYTILLPPEKREEALVFFGHQLMKRIPNTYSEYPVLTKDGQEFWIGQNVQLVVDGDTVSGFQIVARDITERKRTEDELKSAHTKLEALWNVSTLSNATTKMVSDHILESIARMTQSEYGFYGFVNDDESVMIIHSWSGEAMKNCSMVDKPQHFPISEAGVWAEAIRRREPLILNDFMAANTAKKGMPEGHVELTNLMVVPHFTKGRITSVAAVANREADYNQDDITQLAAFLNSVQAIVDSKQAEEALMESEERFRKFFELSSIGKSITAPDGKFLRINKAFADILGFTIDEMKQINFVEITHPDDLAKSQECVRILLTGEQTNYRFEKRYIHKNGNIVWTDVSTTLLRDDHGTPLHLITSILDITDRKRAEEEKQALEERLQRSEKMEALGLLAGGVAHDLNNVLGIVVGYAEMVLGDIDEKNPMRDDLQSIMEGGQKAAAIVQDLLTLARRGVTGRKVINVNRIILDFSKSPEWENIHANHRHVQIQKDLEPDLLNISASPVHIQKTLMNLVSNASEAMPQGGKINIKTTNQYLDKPISGYDNIREGDYVVLYVSDEGEGISEADLKRIFEPFYTKKIMGRSGTGLGLAVVWGTVKDHQGYIDVSSKEGKGTTFTIYFPVTREDLTKETSSVSMSEYMGNGESILIVDDVKGQRDLATAMLKKLNYTVTSVSSGEEAIEYLKQNKADIIVLDMIMEPGMDGLDTYKKVIEIHPKQKAIIVSGFSESDRVHDAQQLGAGEYVKKPYVQEKLGLAVKKELDKK